MTNDIKYQIRSTKEVKGELHTMRLRVSTSNSMYVIHKVIKKQLHEKRQGSANCKTRSEVRGGGKKPWKQKGTGRARAGSNRSPLWRGGGVIFGPKTKHYLQKVNKKERRLAIRNILFNKRNFTFAAESSSFNFEKPKTKLFLENISKLDINKINKEEKILVIVVEKNKNMLLATRNLKNIEVICADQLNILSIIKAKYLLVEAGAIKIITNIYDGQRRTKRIFKSNQKTNHN